MPDEEPPQNYSSVGSEEVLAKYVFRNSHIRANGTVRPEALYPMPHRDSSMTRHINLSETQIWCYGLVVGHKRNLPLVGRVDFTSHQFEVEGLPVKPAPEPDNPNHCIADGWPKDKPEQMAIAQRICAGMSARKYL